MPTWRPPEGVSFPDIACEQTRRKAFLMEIDALNADVIVQPWERFAYRKAERVKAAVYESTAAAGKAS